MAGEKRVYEYIRVRYIDTVMNAASREKEITALLKDIQPTVEMQREKTGNMSIEVLLQMPRTRRETSISRNGICQAETLS